jgi:hypothetical protein
MVRHVVNDLFKNKGSVSAFTPLMPNKKGFTANNTKRVICLFVVIGNNVSPRI